LLSSQILLTAAAAATTRVFAHTAGEEKIS